MVRPVQHRVLLIGDVNREVYGALTQAMPTAHVNSVGSVFDAIAELSSQRFTAVLAAAEPFERRPEAAVRTLRQLTGQGRLVLLGHPTLELLARKMLTFGADDYIVTPIGSAELGHVFGSPVQRQEPESSPAGETGTSLETAGSSPTTVAEAIERAATAELMLDTLIAHPHNATAATVEAVNALLPEELARLSLLPLGQPNPTPEEGWFLLTHQLRQQQEEIGTLCLLVTADQDESSSRHALSQLGHLLIKTAALQERHSLLQRLAITDELTGLYNARYFRHFLARIIERGRVKRFPVTLLLFDIDDFKQYNDKYGHGVGDDILKQTANLMKRCCRDHDLVARIGGDEFAVVFWDKEGPRQPREPRPVAPARMPQTPLEIFNRFQKLINSVDFENLGPAGQGRLGISAGMAVYPYDAPDVDGLIKAADNALMFGAKQAGKNSIYLVGGGDGQTAD